MEYTRADISLLLALLLVAGCGVMNSDFVDVDRPPGDDDDSARPADDDDVTDDDDAIDDDDATDDDDSAQLPDLCSGGSTLGNVPIGISGFVEEDLRESATSHDGASCLDDQGVFSSDPGTSPWPYRAWQMTGDPGGFYAFELISFDFDPYVVVLDDACGCLAWGDLAPGQSGVRFQLPASGAATVLVTTAAGDETGDYLLGWD